MTHEPGACDLSPRRWTIDREKNMFLISIGYNPEKYDERFFIFFWMNKPILSIKLQK